LFTLHRSRRFWVGLVGLIALWGWFALSICTAIGVTRQRVHPVGHAADEVWSLAQSGGGLGMNYWRQDVDPLPESEKVIEWVASCGWLLSFQAMPRFRVAGISEYFIPYWPLAVFWTVYWPFWIRRGERGDRTEVKVDRGLNRGAGRGQPER
jgi:hypothetical protein